MPEIILQELARVLHASLATSRATSQETARIGTDKFFLNSSSGISSQSPQLPAPAHQETPNKSKVEYSSFLTQDTCVVSGRLVKCFSFLAKTVKSKFIHSGCYFMRL